MRTERRKTKRKDGKENERRREKEKDKRVQEKTTSTIDEMKEMLLVFEWAKVAQELAKRLLCHDATISGGAVCI